MTVIPVVDLLRGQVVRAAFGDRQAYRPIVSALCESHAPATVARVLCEHVDARCLYIADLDALQGEAPQAAAIADIAGAVPGVELWVDAGFEDREAVTALRRAIGRDGDRVVPVFGSESLRSADALAAAIDAGQDDAILSLDRRDGRELDDAGCWHTPERWPRRVIVMTLERVGAGVGPDLQTLTALRAASPRTVFFGAGGVRNAADLEAAQESGAKGWLVASALHDGGLPRVARAAR